MHARVCVCFIVHLFRLVNFWMKGKKEDINNGLNRWNFFCACMRVCVLKSCHESIIINSIMIVIIIILLLLLLWWATMCVTDWQSIYIETCHDWHICVPANKVMPLKTCVLPALRAFVCIKPFNNLTAA